MLSIRIVTVDHYMSAPIPELDVVSSEFRGSVVKQVPVIRIFGPTITGEKACVHVHGVFPYICVPYDGSEPHSKVSYQLAASLDKAINIALGYSGANTQHIYKVVLVSGVPFYGYHKKNHQFLKIYFYKPSVIKQAISLLQNGAILNRVFQPHEAHVPFILQFFIDFNLHGMSFIHFEEARFRKTCYPDALAKVPEELLLSDSIAAAMSVSHLEADVSASHIVNRFLNPGDGRIVNPGLAAIWEDERRRRSAVADPTVQTPGLHSQRPAHKPSPSDLFSRLRLKETLQSSAHSGDDNSFSGETVSNVSISHPMEAPPNSNILDASFVALHTPQNTAPPIITQNNVDTNPDDTIIDEDLILNLSLSQRRLSQTLDNSVVLDQDDLELINILEGMANTQTSIIESDSVLGSQKSQNKTVLITSNSGVLEREEDSDEECDWLDKTFSAEDDIKKLLDLTMPDFDGIADLTTVAERSPEPKPGTSGINAMISRPVTAGNCSDVYNPENSSSSEEDMNIPQVDGADDDPPKSKRKSLGVRFALRKPRRAIKKGSDEDYEDRFVVSICAVPPPTAFLCKGAAPPIMEPCSATTDQDVNISNNLGSSLSSTISETIDQQNKSAKCHSGESPSIQFVQNSDQKIVMMCKDICQENCCNGLTCSGSGATDTNQNEQEQTMPSPAEVSHYPQPVKENVEYLYSMPALSDSGDIFEFHNDVMNGILMPHVACCPSADVCPAGFVEENIEHTSNYEANGNGKPNDGSVQGDDDDDNCVLRGDPSLYNDRVNAPDSDPVNEQGWPELVTAEDRKINSKGIAVEDNPDNGPSINESVDSTTAISNSSLIRRSVRIACKSRAPSSGSIQALSEENLSPAQFEALNCDPTEMPEEGIDASSSWSPCSCNDISGIPGLTSSACFDIRESLGTFAPVVDASYSDTEMRRLSGALRDGHMDVILQTGSTDSVVPSATSRRDELIRETKKLNLDCQGMCSKAKRRSKGVVIDDYMTDELLQRGRKPLPGPPPLLLNRGKDMALAAKLCKTSGSWAEECEASGDASTVNTLHTLKKEMRIERKMKLSLSLRKKRQHDRCTMSCCVDTILHKTKKTKISRKKVKSSLSNSYSRVAPPLELQKCHVVLERLTKYNIKSILKEFKIKLLDKRSLGIVKGRPFKIKREDLSQESNKCLVKRRTASWNGTELNQRCKGVQKKHKKVASSASRKPPSETQNVMPPPVHYQPSCIKTRSGASSVRSSVGLIDKQGRCFNPDSSGARWRCDSVHDCKEPIPAPYLGGMPTDVERGGINAEEMKSDDSGVETLGEVSSPHVVDYKDITESCSQKGSPACVAVMEVIKTELTNDIVLKDDLRNSTTCALPSKEDVKSDAAADAVCQEWLFGTNLKSDRDRDSSIDVIGKENPEDNPEDESEDSILISLDVSDQLLFAAMECCDENAPCDSCTKSPVGGSLFDVKPRHLAPDLCALKSMISVDGATTESSSSESSGPQNYRDSPKSPPNEVDTTLHPKEGGACLGNSDQQPRVAIPEKEKRWFSQQFQPWISLWSPCSPAHHAAQMFSPPRAISPDCPGEVGPDGCAAGGPSCMDECSSNSFLNTLSQSDCDAPIPSIPICSSPSNIGHVYEDNKNARVESHSNSGGSQVEVPSQECSLSDMFSEKSLSLESCEVKNCTEYIGSRISVGLSPSRQLYGVEEIPKNIKHEQESRLSVDDENTVIGVERDSLQTNSQDSKASSDSHASVSQQTRASDESWGLQCGQGMNVKADGGVGSSKLTPATLSSNLFTPICKPPSPKEVLESLDALLIPRVVHLDPYYSVHSDVKGKKEVGGNVLELLSHKCVHLDDFSSTITDLVGLNEQQKQLFKQSWALSQVRGDVNEMISYHFDHREVSIAPVKKPPGVREVILWEKARKLIQRGDTVEESVNVRSKRIPVPLSPGEDSDGKSECSLNLSHQSIDPSSPSPVDSKSKRNASTPQLPKSTVARELPSPVSPVFTPISKSKSRLSERFFRKNVRSKKRLCVSRDQTPFEDICEQPEDDGVAALSPADASLDFLLQDSQFQRQAYSPTVRAASDASACQIKGPKRQSQEFKIMLENLRGVRAESEHQFLTLLVVELHIRTCGGLRPDPERDPIQAVFYTVVNDAPEALIPPRVTGIIAVNGSGSDVPVLSRTGLSCNIVYATDEKALLQETISVVRQWDPDILAGYEVEMLSWGYLIQRAQTLSVNMKQELSRVPHQKPATHSDDDAEDNNGLSGIKLPGRIVLDVWRLLRTELALQSYTFENIMYHVLHQRVSQHSFERLSKWWEHPSHLFRWITAKYYQLRVEGVCQILDQLDLIGRTSELARLFGIQFFEVLSRGSQFRVESMMLRMAKPHNYVPLSPSVEQRAHMRAPEYVPLIMEPESRFYKDPVIVLDFQSLYPSIIIAYNYCFSTCLGRVEHLGKSSYFEFGASHLRIPNSFLRSIEDNLSFSPCGVGFVSSNIRRGILPSMLEEILEARLAVKQSMKLHKGNHALQRILHARQLGLKLIANVTYGYTAANFSGRMPCIEVGDSVVSKGRETLERAIALVNNNKEWQTRVVYGDTDSMFVLVPGRTRQEAFRIGAEIADAVTRDNPSPIKLKLEKVYQPSILQTKKRYVGFMYESADQREPTYEAKGIETVRRDGCPAVAKMLEQSLRLLFEKSDVSLVKRYVCHQFSKLMSGRANIQDLIYAREYRGMANYKPGSCVPALELTRKWLKTDRRAEPRIGERVPYVVVNGPPGQALIHLVRHPQELLADLSLRYNAVYYITRAIIPPLARCLSLLGADVMSWYDELPRKHQHLLPASVSSGAKKTISQYFSTLECACCGELTHGGACAKCLTKPQVLATVLLDKAHIWEATYLSISKVCQSCLGRSDHLDCTSLDCPITYRRHQAFQQLKQSTYLHQLMDECLFVQT